MKTIHTTMAGPADHALTTVGDILAGWRDAHGAGAPVVKPNRHQAQWVGVGCGHDIQYPDGHVRRVFFGGAFHHPGVAVMVWWEDRKDRRLLPCKHYWR